MRPLNFTVRPMLIPQQPTYKTAGAAGVFTAVTVAPVEWWLYQPSLSLVEWQRSLLWLAASVVFSAVPFYLCVMGREPIITSRWWIFDSEQRANFIPFGKRVAVYVLSIWCLATVVGIAHFAMTIFARG